jgi:hypothetical protein
MTKNEAQATLDFLNQRWLGYENGKHKFYLLADDLKELREIAGVNENGTYTELSKV